MTLRVLAISILTPSLFAGASSAEEEAVWLRDLDAAKQEAKASHREILIVFTGKGWCVPCQLLEREVLTQPAFERRVRGDYVLVELDFTFGATKEEEARELRFRNLQERYLVRGFPTVVLADADGVPYAIGTGYSQGIGVTPSLVMIKLAQTARALRDRNFRLATATTGRERAEHLHQGITAVAGLLGSLWIARPTTCTTSDVPRNLALHPLRPPYCRRPQAIPGKTLDLKLRQSRSGSLLSQSSRAGPGGLAWLPGGDQAGE